MPLRDTLKGSAAEPAAVARRILVVDDEEDHAASLRDLFERLLPGEPRVDMANDPEQARALLRDQAYDLVISDEGMPGGSGTDLLRWFHERRPAVPKVLMSAYPEESIGRAALRAAGVKLFLLKPFDQADMLRQVERLLAEPPRNGDATAPSSN